MKQTILAILVSMSVAVTAQAQAPKTKKMSVQTAPAQSYSYNSYSAANNEVTALLGFTAGAPNFGADYIHNLSGWGFGGYFFFQANKDKNSAPIVSQAMSFGGLLKVNVIETNNVKFFVAPGAGLTIVKDGSLNASGSKSDETVIGPIWKMGVSYKLAPNFNLGLETMAFGNFFNDGLNNYMGPSQYYSVAGSFAF